MPKVLPIYARALFIFMVELEYSNFYNTILQRPLLTWCHKVRAQKEKREKKIFANLGFNLF